MTQAQQKPEPLQPLVPANMRPRYNAAEDKVLQAIRAEVLDLMAKPFDGRTLGEAQILLQHASEILQLRRGAQRRRRGRSNSYYVSNLASSFGDEEEEITLSNGDEVLADAPKNETFATHFAREALGVVKGYFDANKKDDAHVRMLAIESAVRAMVQAGSLPDGVREEVVGKLREQFDESLAGGGETFDVAPDLLPHPARRREPDQNQGPEHDPGCHEPMCTGCESASPAQEAAQ